MTLAADQRLPVNADAGTLPALRATLYSGRLVGSVLDERAGPVAVLGSGAARCPGIGRLDRRPVILVGGTPFTVVDAGRRSPSSASSVTWTARRR
ncbi:hypothetical protein ACFV2D_04520 [Streptomyces capillispiralis]|uniref:hypothetical protein n=1 Tax=Streptomyces capillispiralis TaxID=68182 RepID=UPI0036782CF6